MGVIFLGILLIGFFYLMYYLIKFCSKRFSCCEKLRILIKNFLFYRWPLRYVIVSYLTLTSYLLAFLCYESQKDDSSKPVICFYSFSITFLILWPLWTLYILLKNHSRLEDPAFSQKYRAIYVGIRTNWY